MANVYLLTGFNNWGKTHLITGLFGQKRFSKSSPAHFSEHDFCVVPQSNDDLGEIGFINAYQARTKSLRDNGHAVTHVVSAFCPTKEPTNDSLAIARRLFSRDRIFLIPIEYKWCGHAKLELKEITSHFASVKNLQVHPLSQKNSNLVLRDLKALLTKLL
jgi:hypothetical protein